MRVGVVGATTPTLPTISSPRNVTLRSADLASTAVVVQNQIDMLDRPRRQQDRVRVAPAEPEQRPSNSWRCCVRSMSRWRAAATNCSPIRAHRCCPTQPPVAGTYPIYVADVDGRQVPIVTTEGNYKYAGRIDLRFDAAGNLLGIDEAKSFPRRVVVSDAAATAARHHRRRGSERGREAVGGGPRDGVPGLAGPADRPHRSGPEREPRRLDGTRIHHRSAQRRDQRRQPDHRRVSCVPTTPSGVCGLPAAGASAPRWSRCRTAAASARTPATSFRRAPPLTAPTYVGAPGPISRREHARRDGVPLELDDRGARRHPD